MRMSTMEKRLQVLLDDERFSRISHIAARRGASIGSVVREAIDVAFPSVEITRQEAVKQFLACSDDEPADTNDQLWEKTKTAMADELEERFA